MSLSPAVFHELSATCGDVTVRLPTDADIEVLADAIAAGGLDDPQTRAGVMSWSDGDPVSVAAGFRAHCTTRRDELAATPEGELWTAPFVVFVSGIPVGMQTVHAVQVPPDDLVVGTGSWLLNTCRGTGIGTSARRAAVALMFAAGAVRAETSWRTSNDASATVSAKLGYQLDGLVTKPRGDGTDVVCRQAHVTPETFVVGSQPVTFSGLR